jgi:hypothetical protein
MRVYSFSAWLLVIILVPAVAISQDAGPALPDTSAPWNITASDAPGDTSAFRQLDIKDWLVGKGWMKKKPEKNKFFLVIPVVAANPTAGFIFGAGFTLAYKTAPTDTRLSTASSNATYSSNHLLNLNVKTNAFVFHEKMVLNGDWRYLINSETTYGLGTKSRFSGQTGLNGYNISNDSLGDPLQFRHIRVDEIASWQIFRNFFAGAGFQFDHRYNITDEELNAGDTALAYHYRYSKVHGFDSSKYTTSGFCLNLLFDSRDNGINTYSGFYGNINYQINSTSLGSSKNSSLLLLEYRSFHSLDGDKRRNILSFWLYGNFVTSGEVPYLALPAIGYDLRQRTGRGYSFGRFRGEDLLYGESEYRFPISAHTGILGGVVFVNCTSTTNRMQNIALLDYLQVSSGTGLRIMLDKKSRTRLEVDAAIAHRSVGFYFGAQETF